MESYGDREFITRATGNRALVQKGGGGRSGQGAGRKKRGTRTEVHAPTEKDIGMMNVLLIIGIILLVLWLLGLVSSYTLGGLI